MRYIKVLLNFILVFSTVAFTSCEKDTYEFGEIIAPANLEVSAVVVGVDDANPNGDGSGLVEMAFHADNAITYKVYFDGREVVAPSGKVTLNFLTLGLHEYPVTVIAYGKAGVSSSKVVNVTVYYAYQPPADLLEMLHNGEGGSRTWRVMAEKGGHFGVGQANDDKPGDWSAPVNDKDGLGCYDDRMIFHSDGSFEYITNGDIFGKNEPMLAAFPEGDVDWPKTGWQESEFWNWPIENYTDTYYLSEPNGKETLTFNGNGFFGLFVGKALSYEFTGRSDNEMSFRTIGEDGAAWYYILIADD